MGLGQKGLGLPLVSAAHRLAISGKSLHTWDLSFVICKMGVLNESSQFILTTTGWTGLLFPAVTWYTWEGEGVVDVQGRKLPDWRPS